MMDPNSMVELGSQGALVAVILACFKALEAKTSKKTNGSLGTKVAVLEAVVADLVQEVGKMQASLSEFRKEFCEHREEVRLHRARGEAKEEALREVGNG